MKALVVHESMSGNTEQVARAVARGLSERLQVERRAAATAPAPITEPLDLIVVGGRHRPADTGLWEWMARLGRGPHAEMVAVFDTRVEQDRHLSGSAERRPSRTVERLGHERIGRESFYVLSDAGPLEPGELDRAESWGRHLAAEMALRAVGHLAGGRRPVGS